MAMPRSAPTALLITSVLSLVLLPACSRRAEPVAPDLLRAALVPIAGTSLLDRDLARAQDAVRSEPTSLNALERLGTLLIAKARSGVDAGYYKLAEQVALAMERQDAENAPALLLRGHVLQSLHAFAEAETVARRLVAKRGLVHDHGLLGDVLYDRGQLQEAAQCYQRMLDLKPCLQSYARAAQMRWIRGDLAGARGLLDLAVGAGSVRDPEAQAWTYARLATVALQVRDFTSARDALATALRLQPSHVQSLLARVRLCTAEGDALAALRAAEAAAVVSEEVEVRWAHADCLRALGRETEAGKVEAALEASGALDDPRTFALYLATRGKDAARAARLAEQELAKRSDPLTHDAVAFTALRAGDRSASRAALDRALAAGIRDARVLVHAALLASAEGDARTAARHREDALAMGATLLPSERGLLERVPGR